MSGRIVILAGHVIAQFHDGTGWWTASKANNNEESDFAVWPSSSEEAIRKAMRVIGDVPVVRASCAPLQRGNAWYTDRQDHAAKSYNEALRALARAM